MKRFLTAYSLLAACTPTPEPNVPSNDAASPSTAPPEENAQGHEGHHQHAHHHGHGHGEGFHKDFSDAEGFAEHFDAADRDGWQKPAEVVDLLQLEPGHTVADVGAGTGYFVSHLAARVTASGRVLALDVEPNMVEHMKRRGEAEGWTNVEARVVAPDDPGLAPESVDRILVVDTWHHISNRVAYAEKLHRALRPGGTLAVVDYTLDSDQGPPPEHRLPSTQVVEELTRAGFQATLATESLPKQYVVLGRR